VRKKFMKKLMAILIMALGYYNSSAQDEKVFEKVELNAHTDPALLTRHIKMNIDLPDSVVAKIPPGTYKAEVEFIIDVHGYMGQLKLTKDPGYGLGQRAMQIMKNYQGKWQAASQCGRFVKSYLKQPIVFIIPKKP
jgi:hypothetical protein